MTAGRRPDDERAQDRRAAGLRRRARRPARRRGHRPGRRAAQLRPGARGRLPGHRRRARHLGRPGRHRQAGWPTTCAAARRALPVLHGLRLEHRGGRARAHRAASRRRARRTATWTARWRCWKRPAAAAGRCVWPSGIWSDALTHLEACAARPALGRRPAPGGPVRHPQGLLMMSETVAAVPATVARQAPSRASEALARACDHLLSLQDEAGWWKGELRDQRRRWTPRTCCCGAFLGILDRRRARADRRLDPLASSAPTGRGRTSTAGPATSRRRSRPTWRCASPATRPTPTTCAGRASSSSPTAGWSARACSRGIWLALFGVWRWDDLPALPPELIFLPSWVPCNIYDWACWARQTHRAAHRRRGATGRGASWASASTSCARGSRPPRVAARSPRGPAASSGSTACCTSTSGIPNRALRRGGAAARRRVDRAPAGGRRLVGRHPAAVGLLDHGAPPARLPASTTRCCRRPSPGSTAFTVHEDGMRRLEACQSPVWDTALADDRALRRRPAPATTPPWSSAAGWLLDEEITRQGRLGGTPPRACARAAGRSSSRTTTTPTSTTRPRSSWRCAASITPSRRGWTGPCVAGPAGCSACSPSDGGWGAFDADNTRELIYELPFCDFGAVIDPPSADVTAHVVEMLAGEGLAARSALPPRACEWLRDGAGGRTARGSAAGAPTTSTAPAPPCRPPWPPVRRRDDERLRAAVRWLESHQNEDGGWGEDLRSYDDPAAWSGRGASTASQTAWALLALLAAGERRLAGGRARHRLSRRHPDAGGHLGRAPLHRHRLPRRLLHQLPPLPARLPDPGARAATSTAVTRAGDAGRLDRAVASHESADGLAGAPRLLLLVPLLIEAGRPFGGARRARRAVPAWAGAGPKRRPRRAAGMPAGAVAVAGFCGALARRSCGRRRRGPGRDPRRERPAVCRARPGRW